MLNCLHYADYDNSDNDDTFLLHGSLVNMLSEAAKCPNLNAIQLDMVWPEPGLIWMLRQYFQGEIILQIGARAMAKLENDPKQVAWVAARYEGLVDRFLFDRSMGRGLGLDAQTILPYMREVRDKMPDMTDAQFVNAGGLGPHTLHLLEPILEEFPGVSIDAQSRLRTSGNAADPISWSLAAEYLKKSLRRFWEIDKF